MFVANLSAKMIESNDINMQCAPPIAEYINVSASDFSEEKFMNGDYEVEAFDGNHSLHALYVRIVFHSQGCCSFLWKNSSNISSSYAIYGPHYTNNICWQEKIHERTLQWWIHLCFKWAIWDDFTIVFCAKWQENKNQKWRTWRTVKPLLYFFDCSS